MKTQFTSLICISGLALFSPIVPISFAQAQTPSTSHQRQNTNHNHHNHQQHHNQCHKQQHNHKPCKTPNSPKK